MAKYKAYPAYKTTGLGWLTEIPDHWEVKKLKYLGQAIIGLTYSPDDVVDEGEGTLVLRSSNVQNGKLEFLDNVYVRKSIPLHLKVKEGDILICARNGSRALIGKNAKITKDAEGMTFGAFMSIFRSRYNNYLSHVFASALFEYQSGSFLTATINQLTTSNLNSFEIPLPPQTEQDRIVNFLDHETAKIDNLIEKQQQLIELLKEKRQAVISHAVTKGLNPDVPMKDSGVEWLGEVPEHWTISTLKHHAKFIDGDRGSEYPNDNDLVDDGVVFLSSKNISNWEINIDDANYISREKFNRLNRGKTINGDVIVKVRGSTGRIGELAIFETERLNKSTAFINAQMMIIRLKNSFNNRFLCNVAQGHYWMEQLNVGAYGTAQQQLNNAIFSGMIMVVPPIDEQLTINKFLELEIKRFDGLIKNTSNMIQLIQERRTALISAAVTGKIDVRDWVAPDMQVIEESQEVTA
ncbi:restriction endonuclease subunit S [Klebsiella aerogenes]|nr:restriction endonuclease subunit S [Klebsiella aerogenes]